MNDETRDDEKQGAGGIAEGDIDEMAVWTAVLTLPRLTRSSNWKTPQGALIKVSAMTKAHLQQTIATLKRWTPSIAPANELRKEWLKVMETELKKRP